MGNGVSYPGFSIFPSTPPASDEPVTAAPTESLNGLKVEESAACPSVGLARCFIDVDATITSSSVVLSRDILGKLEIPDEGTASDEWVWDETFDFVGGKPVWSGWARRDWSGGNWYTTANPAKFNKDGYNQEGKRWANYHKDGRTDATEWARQDIQDWTDDQNKYEKSRGATKQVYIWNPSDDNIVELNRETYGALTKLFLKPTLPFKVSFNDGIATHEIPQVKLISVFHPCPIRIESVQYDAVIQIGDFRGLSGTECIQEVDNSSRAQKALNKQKGVLDRRIEKAREQATRLAVTTSGGYRSPEYLAAKSSLDALIAQKDALALPKKRVCEPRDGAADRLVIFVPLKINDRPRPGAQYEQTRFVNTFANKIPSILGAQPDRYLGYPDVPAATQNDWKLSSILDPTDCYYTWKVNLTGQSQPVTVVFMKNPIAILSSDMGSIKRLPITPPSDVFHSNPKNVRFKPCTPRDISGVPIPCLARAPPQKVPGPKTQARIEEENKPAAGGTEWLAFIGTIGSFLLLMVAVWLAVKFANGPGGTALKGFGNYIGRTLAGTYDAAKKTASSTIGIGSTSGPFPPRRPGAVTSDPPSTPSAAAGTGLAP